MSQVTIGPGRGAGTTPMTPSGIGVGWGSRGGRWRGARLASGHCPAHRQWQPVAALTRRYPPPTPGGPWAWGPRTYTGPTLTRLAHARGRGGRGERDGDALGRTDRPGRASNWPHHQNGWLEWRARRNQNKGKASGGTAGGFDEPLHSPAAASSPVQRRRQCTATPQNPLINKSATAKAGMTDDVHHNADRTGAVWGPIRAIQCMRPGRPGPGEGRIGEHYGPRYDGTLRLFKGPMEGGGGQYHGATR